MTNRTPAPDQPPQTRAPETSGMLLSQYLSVQPLPSAFLMYLQSLADSLAALHRTGYYCLDLRPENVICHSDGTASLTAGCHRKEAGAFLTWEPEQWGLPETTAYTAPELRRYTGEYIERHRLALHGGRADVYSLGLILWQYLAGFPVLTWREILLLRRWVPGTVSRDAYAPVCRALPSSVLKAMDALAQKALSRTVASRLATAEAFRDALQEIRAMLPRE